MSEQLATYQSAPLAASIFATVADFELAQRIGKTLAASDLVPKSFQGNLANCVVALEMANRIGASPFAVLQNLYVIHGRPSWSAQFLIAMVNGSKRFSPLQFRMEGEGKDRSCVAHAKSLSNGETVEGPPVSMAMAKAEGWIDKPGSKWQTMPEIMLRYRAASFFAKLYAPDLTMGMQTAEELADMPPERNVTPPPQMTAGPAIETPAPATEPKEAPEPPKPEPTDDKAERLAVVKKAQATCREFGVTPAQTIPALIRRGIVPETTKPGDLIGLPLDTLEAVAAAMESICADLKEGSEA